MYFFLFQLPHTLVLMVKSFTYDDVFFDWIESDSKKLCIFRAGVIVGRGGLGSKIELGDGDAQICQLIFFKL